MGDSGNTKPINKHLGWGGTLDIKKVFSKNVGSLVLGLSRTIEHAPWGRRRQRRKGREGGGRGRRRGGREEGREEAREGGRGEAREGGEGEKGQLSASMVTHAACGLPCMSSETGILRMSPVNSHVVCLASMPEVPSNT